MESKWYFKLLLWAKNGIDEIILCVDLNDYDENFFKYWGENEKDILLLLSTNTQEDYTDRKIYNC